MTTSPTPPVYKIAGICFDHAHIGDLLRMAREHPQVEIVGVADADLARVAPVADRLGIPPERRFADYAQCLTQSRPDIVILCPATARHAEWVERVAPYNTHILVEKPFASSLADADRMTRAVEATGKTLVVNWPLAWYPPHITTKRLIDEGAIGTVREVHYYDGNRGPLRHVADKIEISAEEASRQKSESWWYQRDSGGGSLLDYLGYGVTLGTWFHGGRAPLEVMCLTDAQPGLEVDEHSVTVARYAAGLSKYETRWGTFTDPWTMQPQPKCGFVVVGATGTLSSCDYEDVVRIQTQTHPQTRELPVDVIAPPYQNPIQYLLHCLTTGEPIDGPLSPALSRIGQQIVDTAAQSARERRALPLSG